MRLAILMLLMLAAPAAAATAPCPVDPGYAHIRDGAECVKAPVQSTWIEWIEFCRRGDATVFFMKVKTGQQREYAYLGVPAATWEAFLFSPSPGHAFHALIRDKFACRRG